MQDEADWLSPGNDFSSLSSDLLCSPEETTRVSQSIALVRVCVRVQEGATERKFYDAPEQDCGDTSCIFIGNEIDWLAN